jgi:hypothetical protein
MCIYIRNGVREEIDVARPRTIRTMLKRIGNVKLKAMWELRDYPCSPAEKVMLREAIREQVAILKLKSNNK